MTAYTLVQDLRTHLHALALSMVGETRPEQQIELLEERLLATKLLRRLDARSLSQPGGEISAGVGAHPGEGGSRNRRSAPVVDPEAADYLDGIPASATDSAGVPAPPVESGAPSPANHGIGYLDATRALIAWTPADATPDRRRGAPGTLFIRSWPDPENESRPWIYWMPAAGNKRFLASELWQVRAMVMMNFHLLTVRDGIDPQRAHEEFLKVKEYADFISPDVLPKGRP